MGTTLAFIPTAALLLSGCAFLSRPLVPVRYYSIDPPAAEAPAAAAPADLVLAVRTLGAAPRYGERILFRRGHLAAGHHENERWIDPPADMASAVLRRTLDGRAIVRVVADDRLVRRPDLLLDGRVTRFDEVQTDPHWLAECEIELLLKQADDGTVLFAARFDARREAKAKTTAAIAEAMNAAVAEVAAKAADAVAHALAGLKKADAKP
jgi:ABC-type uncharacterized transport system auxiliary subunit